MSQLRFIGFVESCETVIIVDDDRWSMERAVDSKKRQIYKIFNLWSTENSLLQLQKESSLNGTFYVFQR